MNLHDAMEFLDKQVSNSSNGLPDEIFLFISRLTPMVNVDLLIKNENGQMLLSWRDDQFAGAGWHLPGGIIRFKEKLETSLQKVAESEIGTAIQFDHDPIALNQVICHHDIRGHFISILYRCYLSTEYIPLNKNLMKTDNGYLLWHDSCPENLITVHEMYRKYI